MTAQDLKNSILQLAIQGKLVEQREEEGTAEELYEQIQEEKQKLIKEKKIKKSKPLPEITQEEIPFDIPDSWKWVRIGNIGSWASGATPSRSNPKYYNGDIPWLKTGDLNNSYIENTSEFISKKALENTSVRLNPIGSVLIAMYGATIGKLGILKLAATTNQACCACVPYKGFFNKYLFYYLMSQKYNFTQMSAGGAQPNISKEKIINYIIPLPPLQEQKRIVEKIEKLMPYIDKYDKVYNELTKLNNSFPTDIEKSILQYAIQGKLVEQREEEGTAEELYKLIQEEKQRLIKENKIKKSKPLPEITEEEIPFDIPDSWKWVRMGNIGAWASGSTPSRSNPEYYNGDIPWLKTGDLNNSYIENTSEFISKKALENTSVKLNPIGSVLIAMYGATIGKLGILKIAATTNQACCACIPYKGLYNKYLFFYLMSQKYNFTQISAGGAQPNISKEKIINYIIPLPPIEEQKRIVEKIEELMNYTKRLNK